MRACIQLFRFRTAIIVTVSVPVMLNLVLTSIDLGLARLFFSFSFFAGSEAKREMSNAAAGAY